MMTLSEIVRRVNKRVDRRITRGEIIDWAEDGAIDVSRDVTGAYEWKRTDVESIVRYIQTGQRASPTLHEIWEVETKAIQAKWFARPTYNQTSPPCTGKIPSIREFGPIRFRGTVLFSPRLP